MFRRRVILDILEEAIRKDAAGSFAKEHIIHELIMPMRTTSDDVHPDACNLWILDERLAFHHYLSSDKAIRSMPVTTSDSLKEPDILALRVHDGPFLVSEGQGTPLASINVVEFKRPMTNASSSQSALFQALDYLKKVRQGRVTSPSGRPVQAPEHIPGFIYVIADLDDHLRADCERMDLEPTDDGLGFFGFNKRLRAYIEVTGYDRLLNLARQRNRAFFDKLGLPVA